MMRLENSKKLLDKGVFTEIGVSASLDISELKH